MAGETAGNYAFSRYNTNATERHTYAYSDESFYVEVWINIEYAVIHQFPVDGFCTK